LRDPISKIPNTKERAGIEAQVVECLPFHKKVLRAYILIACV
jgi:hypothetical protein